MIKALIFDMDGTILNTIDDITDSVNYALHQFNLPLKAVEEVKLAVGNGAKHLIAKVIDSGYNHPLFNDIYQTYQSYYDAHRMIKTAPYPEILTLLKKLKYDGYQLAVVSNKHDYLVKSLNKSLFEGLFEFAVGETKDRPLKPAPNVIYDVVDLLNIGINEAVFIGDSDVDMITAKNANMTSIGVTWGFRSKDELVKEGAHYIVNHPLEILDLVKEI